MDVRSLGRSNWLASHDAPTRILATMTHDTRTPPAGGFTRRSFLSSLVAGGAGMGLTPTLLAAVQRAFAVEPEPGTTWADAEHVVFLMQENRSFDHVYGSLQGVRGFNDP